MSVTVVAVELITLVFALFHLFEVVETHAFHEIARMVFNIQVKVTIIVIIKEHRAHRVTVGAFNSIFFTFFSEGAITIIDIEQVRQGVFPARTAYIHIIKTIVIDVNYCDTC